MAARKRRRHTPAEKQQAVAMIVEQGYTNEFVASSFGVTPKTIAQWKKQYKKPIAARAQQLAPEEPEPDTAPDVEDLGDEGSSLDLLKRLMRDTRKRLRNAEAAGNHTVVQRMGRDLAQMANTIARLERLEQADADLIPLTRDQLVEAKSRVVAAVQALESRPLHCAACARKLSVSWGRDGRDQLERTENERRGSGQEGGDG